MPRMRPIRDDRPQRRGFDFVTWIVPSIGFIMFLYAMGIVVVYTIRIGGSDVSLYNSVAEEKKPPETDVYKVLKGISDGFDPNAK